MRREFFNMGGTTSYGDGSYSTTDEHGAHYNEYGEYLGYTDSDGAMWDDRGDYIGYTDSNGGIYDDRGDYLGYVDDYGNAYGVDGGALPKEVKADTGVPKGCFLTTACVEFKGLEDDCYELTTLRAFRDNYMTGDMKSDVEEYYRIAPGIVDKINSLDEDSKKKEYEYIYDVIKKCCKFIESSDEESAYKLYKDMVNKLSCRFI